MKVPKSFLPDKDLSKKVEELLNSKLKNVKDGEFKRAEEEFLSKYKSLVDRFDNVYSSGEVCKSGSKEDRKKSAEIAYALAVLAMRSNNKDSMNYYAKKSIEIYKVLDVHTLEDACPYHNSIEGVNLPDIMHEGVVVYNLSL